MIIFFRLLLIGLLSLVIIKPEIERTKSVHDVVALIDASESMKEDHLLRAIEQIRSAAGSDATITAYPFSGRGLAQGESFESIRSISSLRSRYPELQPMRTSLAEALKLAENHGVAFLVSDGNENKDSVENMIDEGKIALPKIYPLIPADSSEVTKGTTINSLVVPQIVDPNAQAQVKVGLNNSSLKDETGTITFFQNGKEVAKKEVTIAGQNGEVVHFETVPIAEGMQELKAVFTSKGQEQTSEYISFISVKERDKVLLIGGAVEDNRYISESLREEQFKVKASVGALSQDEKLSEYHTVVLNNIAADRLTEAQLGALRDYTRNGGRLVMIGGERSFGLGKYRNTPVEDALPVEMVPPQTEKKRLNVAVELVLDKSRSMADDNKIEFVKEAAREVIRNLKNEDYVGVIGFDATPFIVVKMGMLAKIREQAMDRISRLFASSRTNLMPAIEEGKRTLMRVDAGRKHMIILTDGKIPDGNPYYVEMIKQLRIVGITVSTVMLGDEREMLLRDMAEAGGGAFYQTSNPNALPRIFLSDIKVSSGEKTLKEDTEYAIRTGPAGVVSTGLQGFPSVKGYVQTKAKDRSSVELVTYGEGKAEPFLVSWQFGKGKGIAYTGDANGKWSERWIYWPKFHEFWSEIINGKENADTKEIAFDLKPVVMGGTISLDFFVYSRLSQEQVTATIKSPDGQDSELQFKKITEGRYKGIIQEGQGGKYQVTVKAGGKKLPPVGFYISPSQFDEKSKAGINYPLLQRIASRTGGMVNPSASDLVLDSHTTSEPFKLRWPVTALILFLFLFEILFRYGGFVSNRFIKFPSGSKIF